MGGRTVSVSPPEGVSWFQRVFKNEESFQRENGMIVAQKMGFVCDEDGPGVEELISSCSNKLLR